MKFVISSELSMLPWYTREFFIRNDCWNVLVNKHQRNQALVFSLTRPGIRSIGYFLTPGISNYLFLNVLSPLKGVDETRICLIQKNVIDQSNVANATTEWSWDLGEADVKVRFWRSALQSFQITWHEHDSEVLCSLKIICSSAHKSYNSISFFSYVKLSTVHV